METVGEKKLGIGLVKWMGEDKNVYGRKGREGYGICSLDMLQQTWKSSVLCTCLPYP